MSGETKQTKTQLPTPTFQFPSANADVSSLSAKFFRIDLSLPQPFCFQSRGVGAPPLRVEDTDLADAETHSFHLQRLE